MRSKSSADNSNNKSIDESPNMTCVNSFMHKISAIRKRRVTATNENIKNMKNNRLRKTMTSQYSQQFRRISITNKKESKNESRKESKIQKLTVNPEITQSSFYIKIFSPISKSKALKISKESNKSLSNYKPIASPRNFRYVNEIKILSSFLNEADVMQRLLCYSKQTNKNSIRVYKDDLHKVIAHRYGKDRITTFLNFEYIEDFESISKTLQELLALKKQEMLLMVFLILDQNKDGVLTSDDLINALGTKRQEFPLNPLVLEDVNKIVTYVSQRKLMGVSFEDCIVLPIIRDDNFTLMKYRMHIFRKKKEQQAQNRRNVKTLLTLRMHEHLFSLHHNPEDQITAPKFNFADILTFIARKKVSEMHNDHKNVPNFIINFDTFSKIFVDDIPKIFLDFLYVFGGLRVPGQSYAEINISMILGSGKQLEKVKSQFKINQFQRTLTRLQKMKDFHQSLKIVRYYSSKK